MGFRQRPPRMQQEAARSVFGTLSMSVDARLANAAALPIEAAVLGRSVNDAG
jgi:hypothetical protein